MFIDRIPEEYWEVMASWEWTPTEGEVGFFRTTGATRAAKLLSARHLLIERCELTTGKEIFGLRQVERLTGDERWSPAVCFQGKCLGTHSKTRTVLKDWKVRVDGKDTQLDVFKSRRIYKALVQRKTVRPSAENAWTSRLGPPAKGWSQV